MKRKLKAKLLVSFLATATVYAGSNFLPATLAADDYDGTDKGGIVKIKNGDVYDEVYGVNTKNTDTPAENGQVTVSGGSAKEIYGGYSEKVNGGTTSADANKNKVTITGGTITASASSMLSTNTAVAGGYSNKNTNDNDVVINGQNVSIKGSIYGGVSSGTGNSTRNTVLIIDGTIDKSGSNGQIAGGWVENKSGSAEYNTVEIQGGNIETKSLYGGKSNSGGADFNKAIISGGQIGSSEAAGITFVYGGYVKTGSNGDETSANNNEVVISDTAQGWIRAVYGGAAEGDPTKSTANNNTVTIDAADMKVTEVYGGVGRTEVKNNIVTIKNGTVDKMNSIKGKVYAGKGNLNSTVISDNKIILEGGNIIGDVYAVYENTSNNKSEQINDNTVTIKGTDTELSLENANLYGTRGNYGKTDKQYGNDLIVDNWSGKVNSINNFNTIKLQNIKNGNKVNDNAILDLNNAVDLTNTNIAVSNIDLSENSQHKLISNVVNAENINIGNSIEETDNGVRVHNLNNEVRDNALWLDVSKSVLAGNYTDEAGKTYGDNNLTVNDGFQTNAGIVAGSYASGDNVAENGLVAINGDFTGTVYAGYSENGSVNNNTVRIANGVNAKNLNLRASNTAKSVNNVLDLNGSNIIVNTANGFNDINMNNIEWEDKGTVLTINNKDNTQESLENTNINLKSLKNGSQFNVNDKMTLIKGENLNINPANINQSEEFTAGVVTEGEGKVGVDENGNINYTITKVNASSQTNLVAENRAVAAAFLNQGSDLISDGLDSLNEQYGYGFKTFAAVYGNRSTYDVNSDLKINGWSEIIGLGEKKRFNDSDFAYGAFFENGTGNYRTYNEFNDEFFRGDGSLVYNGGGIAARLSKDSGMYYEGSLRAGTLKSEMNNALKDGNGNSYGYESDSTYYGAHLGLGKVFKLDKDKDLDVYGKFFHVYTDGDSFDIAGDNFEFDSVTSDRLRVGARLTTNKENNWNTYYGLAYEYEFNGDSDMKAGQFKLPTQSLEGSTFIGEIGLNYKDVDSPWSFDLNLKGYQGQRDGFSGSAQMIYTF